MAEALVADNGCGLSAGLLLRNAAYEGSRVLVGVTVWDNSADSPFNGIIDDIRISDVA